MTAVQEMRLAAGLCGITGRRRGGRGRDEGKGRETERREGGKGREGQKERDDVILPFPSLTKF